MVGVAWVVGRVVACVFGDGWVGGWYDGLLVGWSGDWLVGRAVG